MLKTRQISYNPFFHIPFLLWVVTGGIILIVFSRRDIFHAINTNYSDIADTVMVYMTWMGQGSVIIPVLLALFAVSRFRNWWYFLSALLCNIIPFLIEQLLKSMFSRPRPHLLFYDKLWMHYLPEWPYLLERSFPSGHSTGAASFFCFLALLLPQRYARFGFLFFILAMGVCYSRVYLAAHFFEDVYVGSIVGVTITTAIYSIMDKYKDRFFTKKGTFN